jgi:hypothetical protein
VTQQGPCRATVRTSSWYGALGDGGSGSSAVPLLDGFTACVAGYFEELPKIARVLVGRPADAFPPCSRRRHQENCRPSSGSPDESASERTRHRSSGKRCATGVPRSPRRTCIQKSISSRPASPAGACSYSARKWDGVRGPSSLCAPRGPAYQPQRFPPRAVSFRSRGLLAA